MNKYVSIHQNILLDFESQFQNLTSLETFSFKASPDKWSKKEILGHLIDSAYNNHQRFLKAESQPNLIFQGYDQVAWVSQNNYQNRDLSKIFDTCLLANQHLNELIANLPEALLNKESSQHNFHQICMNRIPENQVSSLGYLIWDYLFHLEHHISQLLESYERRVGSFGSV